MSVFREMQAPRAFVGQDGILRPGPGGTPQSAWPASVNWLAGGLTTRRRLPTCPTKAPSTTALELEWLIRDEP